MKSPNKVCAKCGSPEITGRQKFCAPCQASKKATHNAKRPSVKRLKTPNLPAQIRFPSPLAARIIAHKKANKLRSFSASVKMLVERGLKK